MHVIFCTLSFAFDNYALLCILQRLRVQSCLVNSQAYFPMIKCTHMCISLTYACSAVFISKLRCNAKCVVISVSSCSMFRNQNGAHNPGPAYHASTHNFIAPTRSQSSPQPQQRQHQRWPGLGWVSTVLCRPLRCMSFCRLIAAAHIVWIWIDGWHRWSGCVFFF